MLVWSLNILPQVSIWVYSFCHFILQLSIRELKRILTEDSHIRDKKVIVFTEYRSTAMYIYRELQKAGFTNLFEVDGQTSGNRENMIRRFAPYYNGSSSDETEDEIRILIATDVLAEGLNLQDASCLINYELHWNPVRLMQRIGRVDRRRNKEIEQKLLADHPELSEDRENAYYWNFLPPKELEELLALYRTVSRKTLRISKTFGIEGKKLLTPNDDYDALREFNSQYEGTTSAEEEIALAYQQLIVENPDYLSGDQMDQGLSPQESRYKCMRALWQAADRKGLQPSSRIIVSGLRAFGLPKENTINQEEIQAPETI